MKFNRLRTIVMLHVLALGTSSAWAQTPVTVTYQSTRNFFWDWVIVGVLVVGALFAVCRSSRRV